MHAHPLSLYLPSRTKLWCTLQLRGQIHIPLFLLYPYMYSVPTTIVLGSSLAVLHWKVTIAHPHTLYLSMIKVVSVRPFVSVPLSPLPLPFRILASKVTYRLPEPNIACFKFKNIQLSVLVNVPNIILQRCFKDFYFIFLPHRTLFIGGLT